MQGTNKWSQDTDYKAVIGDLYLCNPKKYGVESRLLNVLEVLKLEFFLHITGLNGIQVPLENVVIPYVRLPWDPVPGTCDCFGRSKT